MPSPFPGMDPYVETNPLFHELHTQMLSHAQVLLQPQLQPKYVARLERHLSKSLVLNRQRCIGIYANVHPRQAVTRIELLSPSNKAAHTLTRTQYLEKRSSALHGGLHWVEIDLLRGGQRPPIPLTLPEHVVYLAYVAQATPTGRRHLAYGWALPEPLPTIPIPLLGQDQAELNLAACFQHAYDAVAAGEEVDYRNTPPPPSLSAAESSWVETILREKGKR